MIKKPLLAFRYHDDNTINGWKDNCPKCGSEVFVVENERNGIDISNYPDEEVHEFWHMR